MIKLLEDAEAIYKEVTGKDLFKAKKETKAKDKGEK